MNKTGLSLCSVKQSLWVVIPKPELGNETKYTKLGNFMDSNTIGGIALGGAIVLFIANIFMNDVSSRNIGGSYMYMKTDFPIYGDREILFMGKKGGSKLEVTGVFLPFSWKVNDKEISEKKGIYFVDKQRIIPFDILSTPQKEMYNQALYYLEQGDTENALIPLLGLEAML